MATVHVTLSTVQDRASTGATLPILPALEDLAATVTTSATSGLSGLTATSEGQVWCISTASNIWVKFGTGTPVAVSGAGYMLPAGLWYFGADAGQKCAIKDA